MTSPAHPEMSSYEAEAWAVLQDRWRKKAERRVIPPEAREAAGAAGNHITNAAERAGNTVAKFTPARVKDLGGAAVDSTLQPTITAVLGLLEWVTETVQEFSDPEQVLAFHRKKGREAAQLSDLWNLDLADLDACTKRDVWKWRSTGIVEGGAVGALTFVPIAGSVAAIGLDLVIMHALSTAAATRAAHAYGIDPTTEAGQEHLDRMLTKAWASQTPKVPTMNGARKAFVAGKGRVRWSEKFRNDHRIAAAVEKLMKQVGTSNHVPIDKVVTKMPYIGVVTSMGVNSHVLTQLAKDSIAYSRTLHLAQKYDLPLPPHLA